MKRWLPYPLLLLLLACASPPPVQTDRYYALPEPGGDPAGEQIAASIRVNVSQAAGLMHERAIVYAHQDAALIYQQYHYQFWVDQPTRLVERQWVNTLRSAGLAPLVSDDPREATELLLSGSLERFVRLLEDGGAKALVSMEVRVEKKSHHQPLILDTYHAEVVAEGLEMQDTVQAFGQALQQIFRSVNRDLALKLKIGQDRE